MHFSFFSAKSVRRFPIQQWAYAFIVACLGVWQISFVIAGFEHIGKPFGMEHALSFGG
jgi:hypothetical protein